MRLTDRAVKSLRTEKTQQDIYDDLLSGFGLRVFRTGRKRYFLTYRTKAGRRRRLNIGDANLLTLSDARNKAKALAVEVARGNDPSYEESAYRAAETVGELAKAFLSHSKANNRPRTSAEDERLLEREVLPKWKNLKLPDVRRRDAVFLLQKIVDRGAPITANRTHQLLTRLFNFGVNREVLEVNPLLGMKKMVKEKSRERILDDDELGRFLRALMADDNKIIANGLHLILLLARRRTEVFQMRWDEISDNIWTIPPYRSKNGRPVRVPLPPRALEILNEMFTLRVTGLGADDLVFQSRQHGKGIVEPGKRFRRILREASITDCSIHDLRRTAASGMQRLGASFESIEAILGHAIRGSAGIYMRGERLAEMKGCLQRWEQHLFSITNEEAEKRASRGNVIAFDKRTKAGR